MRSQNKSIVAGHVKPGMEIYDLTDGWLTVASTKRYIYEGKEYVIISYHPTRPDYKRSWTPLMTAIVAQWRPGKPQPLPKVTALLP